MQGAKEAKKLIIDAESIVITSHRSPDGDSIGSSVSMYYYLKALGKNPVICHPDPCPDFLDWCTDEAGIINFEDESEKVEQIMLEADLIFCMDYNGSNRMGDDMGAILDKSFAKKVMIDHHPNPDDFVDISISVPSVCSTCQLVYELIAENNDLELIDAKLGSAIYLGIMTDTGSFRFSSVDFRTHEIIADLIKRGVNHTAIHESTYDNIRLDKLKLRGFALSEKLEVLPKEGVAIVALSDAELSRFNYKKGDTEGIVNMALAIEGVRMAIFLSEKDGKIKMSFRSKGEIPANEVASTYFSGGGHKNAAGGISELSMADTINKLKSVLPKYV